MGVSITLYAGFRLLQRLLQNTHPSTWARYFHQFGDFTTASVGVPRLRDDWSYVMVRSGLVHNPCGLDDEV